MKLVNIGMFDLGSRRIRVVGRPGGKQGHFDLAPLNGLATIEVGFANEWPSVVGTLVHEAAEAVMATLGLRFMPWPDNSDDQGTCSFLMTHSQFSEVCGSVGIFLAAALPKLGEVYYRVRKKKPERHRRRR